MRSVGQVPGRQGTMLQDWKVQESTETGMGIVGHVVHVIFPHLSIQMASQKGARGELRDLKDLPFIRETVTHIKRLIKLFLSEVLSSHCPTWGKYMKICEEYIKLHFVHYMTLRYLYHLYNSSHIFIIFMTICLIKNP